MTSSVAQDARPTLEQVLGILQVHLPDLMARYGVASLGVFGSYVRGEQESRSDLDLLVEFERTPSLLELAALERELSALTHLRVDLVLKRTLKPGIGKSILAEVVYP